MKLLKLERLHKGKFLSYYVADYLNSDGKIKQYEFISRDPELTIEKFGKNAPAGVGMVVFSKDKNYVLLESEFSDFKVLFSKWNTNNGNAKDSAN